MFEFTNEELKQLQQKELELYTYFKDFCNEHNLLFYFCGGCCIGSLRHKGFIPWDDDIDIFMPRDDYEKLTILWNKHADTKKYPLLRTTKDNFCGNIFTTIVDANTTWIKPDFIDLDIPQGIPMDIFPLDTCPAGKFARKKQIFFALLYSLFNAQVVPKKHGGIVSFASRFLLWAIPSKNMRFKIWNLAQKQMTKYNNQESPYITELCAGPHYMKNVYPKQCFTSSVEKEFEGIMCPLPIGYDEYLKIAFGDYMQMPPEEKRQPHHDIVFADINNSYEKYKGIYYLNK